jgi:Tfp pilus assembly protein PilF
VSIDPLLLLASLYWRVGEHAAARQELAAAVVRQPANPESWEHLGCYDLGQHRATAASELHRALVLDPRQTLIRTNPGAFCGYLNS